MNSFSTIFQLLFFPATLGWRGCQFPSHLVHQSYGTRLVREFSRLLITLACNIRTVFCSVFFQNKALGADIDIFHFLFCVNFLINYTQSPGRKGQLGLDISCHLFSVLFIFGALSLPEGAAMKEATKAFLNIAIA